MSSNLKDKVIIVTDCSKGFDFNSSKTIADKDSKLYIVSRYLPLRMIAKKSGTHRLLNSHM